MVLPRVHQHTFVADVGTDTSGIVLVTYCYCVINYFKTQWLEAEHIYYHSICRSGIWA